MTSTGGYRPGDRRCLLASRPMAAKTPRPTGAKASTGTPADPATKASAKTSAKAEATTTAPGPLVSAAWLAEHIDDPDLRIVHVSPERRVYNKRHIAGATYSDLHRELALRGTAPET